MIKSSFYNIEASGYVEWNTDGEQIEHNSARIDVIPEAIEIYVSKRSSKALF